jgi:methionyl-tRNA formyltransferase
MKIVYMGTPDFSVPVLQNLINDPAYDVVCVVTQPDRPKGRKQKLTASPVKVLAEQYGIPVLQPEKVRKPEAVASILAYAPDLLVTAAYGQILPESLLDGPRLGCINVHASLLPSYRGAAPIQQAIIDGKKESGVTIMYMVKKLDAGDILSQIQVPITDDDTFGSLHDKLSAAGSKLLMKTLPELEQGHIHPVVQDETKATFAPSIKHNDEKIDWNRPADEVRNLIRGLSPFPGAFTYLEGNVFKIFSASSSDVKREGAPGLLVKTDDNRLFAAAGDGRWLEIEVCQPAGKKRMGAADFLRGRKLKIGTILGQQR